MVRDRDQQNHEGSDMSRKEEEAKHKYEQERFGHVLERDVNGNPVDEEKLRGK